MKYAVSCALAAATVAASVVAGAGPAFADRLPTGLGVGECVAITDNTPGATVGVRADCGSADAVYRVQSAAHGEGNCPSDEYARYVVQSGDTPTLTLCLAANFHIGACYEGRPDTAFVHVDCGSPRATFRVIERIEGTTDYTLCPSAATDYLTVPDPATLYCATSI